MNKHTISQLTQTRIPTPPGEFQLRLYHSPDEPDKEHLALTMGDLSQANNLLVRIHSECFTGDVLGSMRCDCGPQLHQAMRLIATEGQGVILYLRQEGRGIGLLDKLRAYNLQDEGYDTVEANLMLGHAADARDYTVAAGILHDLNISSIRLMTNNPAKIEGLKALGIQINQRVPLQLPANKENLHYLKTKVIRMNHLLNLNEHHKLNGHVNLYGILTHTLPPARPWVTLTYAQSLDGSITKQQGHPTSISGESAMQLTHQLRASHDALLVGIGTILADNPRLTVRLAHGKDPQPIILDSHLRFPLNARLLMTPHKPWVITTEQASRAKQKRLEKAGAKIIRLPANSAHQVNLTHLLPYLYNAGIHSLMVEGGATIISHFLQKHLVDRVIVTISPQYLGGYNALSPLPNTRTPLPQLHNLRYQQLGQDIVMWGDALPQTQPA